MIQSGFDKVFDWKGNNDFLKSHFSKTFLSGMVPMMLFIVTLLELIGGFLCLGGAIMGIITFDTSLIGAGSLAGKFANGGFAQKGKSYLVGERGPELFTPGATGGQISPMGSTNIVVNVDASGSNVEGDESQSQVLGQVLASAIQSELIKQKRPGGLLS